MVSTSEKGWAKDETPGDQKVHWKWPGWHTKRAKSSEKFTTQEQRKPYRSLLLQSLPYLTGIFPAADIGMLNAEFRRRARRDFVPYFPNVLPLSKNNDQSCNMDGLSPGEAL